MDERDAGSCYGQHLTLLARAEDAACTLDSPPRLAEFLTDLVGRIGMRVLDGPHVASEIGEPDAYGHSGVIILIESHAAIHTYPKRSCFFLDVFSCRPFALEDVLAACRHFFGAIAVFECQLTDRGAHWRGRARDHHGEWAAVRAAAGVDHG